MVYQYSSDTKGLKSDENGVTGAHIERENGEITTGIVTIVIRPGHDDAVVHENRHGRQIVSGDAKKLTVFEAEKDAFIYQQVYDYESVQGTINRAEEKQYPFKDIPKPSNYGLDDMIKFLYGPDSQTTKYVK